MSTWWHHELLSKSSKPANYTGSLLVVAEVAICCGRDRSTIGCSQQRNHRTVYLLQLRDLLCQTITWWGSEWSTSCCGQDWGLLIAIDSIKLLASLIIVLAETNPQCIHCCSQHRPLLAVLETGLPLLLSRSIINSTMFCNTKPKLCAILLSSKTSHG